MIFIICDNNVLIIYIYIAYRDMYIIIYVILGTPISYYICIYIYNIFIILIIYNFKF